MGIFGVGAGMMFIVTLVGIQNRVDVRDLGSATSTSNFCRSLGNASARRCSARSSSPGSTPARRARAGCRPLGEDPQPEPGADPADRRSPRARRRDRQLRELAAAGVPRRRAALRARVRRVVLIIPEYPLRTHAAVNMREGDDDGPAPAWCPRTERRHRSRGAHRRAPDLARAPAPPTSSTPPGSPRTTRTCGSSTAAGTSTAVRSRRARDRAPPRRGLGRPRPRPRRARLVPPPAAIPLPSAEHFADALGLLGIEPTTPVVVYDDARGSVAARLWWMLHVLGQPVAVLDGGLATWAGPLEPGRGVVDAVSCPPRPGPPTGSRTRMTSTCSVWPNARSCSTRGPPSATSAATSPSTHGGGTSRVRGAHRGRATSATTAGSSEHRAARPVPRARCGPRRGDRVLVRVGRDRLPRPAGARARRARRPHPSLPGLVVAVGRRPHEPGCDRPDSPSDPRT